MEDQGLLSLRTDSNSQHNAELLTRPKQTTKIIVAAKATLELDLVSKVQLIIRWTSWLMAGIASHIEPPHNTSLPFSGGSMA
jgi:hypothetical protein